METKKYECADILKETETLLIDVLDNNKFDFIILPIRRAYNLYQVCYRWSEQIQKLTRSKHPRIHSDVFLECDAAKTVFHKDVRVCIFEESIRFGRQLYQLVEKLTKIGVKSENIYIYTLIMDIEYEHQSSTHAKLITKHSHSTSLDELNCFSNTLLETFYRGNVVYSQCLPKSKPIPLATQAEAEMYLQKIKDAKFKEIFIEKPKDILRENNCGYFIRAVENDELIEFLGDGFAQLVDLIYIEAYFFLSKEPELQLLPRISLKPLNADDLGAILEAFIASVQDGLEIDQNSIAEFRARILSENAYIQYSLLEYALAAVVNCKCIYGQETGKIEYHIDFAGIGENFGDEWYRILNQFSTLALHDVNLKLSADQIKIPAIKEDSIEQAETLSDLFLQDSLHDDEKCFKRKRAGYSPRTASSMKRYTVAQLKRAFPDNFLEEYAKILVSGVATDKIHYDADKNLVYEANQAGEGAVVQALQFAKIYYIISEIINSGRRKYRSWKKRGSLYYEAVQLAKSELSDCKGRVFANYVSEPEDTSVARYCEEEVFNLDTDRKTVLELAKKYWVDTYPDAQYWSFETKLIEQAKQIKTFCL